MQNRNKDGLFNRLSQREAEFIESLERHIDKNYLGKFVFVNRQYYVGIKLRGSPISPFLFKKPKGSLIFHSFKVSTKEFIDIVVRDFNETELTQFVDIIGNYYSVCANQSTTSSKDFEPQYTRQLSEEERSFVKEFRKNLEVMYPKMFSFSRTKQRYEISFSKKEEPYFVFKRRKNILLFEDKTKSKTERIEILELNEKYMDMSLKMVVAFVQTKMNEQLVTSKSIQDDNPASFPESLETEERRFVMTFKKIIEDHYPNSFNVFIDKKYLSFKEIKKSFAIFWFIKKNNELCFQCHPKNDDTKTLMIDAPNKETLLKAIKMAKITSDSYDIFSIDEQRDKKLEKASSKETRIDEPKTSNGTLKIYSFIKDEILGLEYKAPPSIKALCRNVKAFLLSTFNKNSENSYENALLACDKELFFGNKLVWSPAAWLRSVKIIYRYFKANTLIERIKDYEEVNEVELVKDYPALLNHLYADLSGFTEIDYSNNLFFKEPLPNRLVNSLNEIEENFKGYEIN